MNSRGYLVVDQKENSNFELRLNLLSNPYKTLNLLNHIEFTFFKMTRNTENLPYYYGAILFKEINRDGQKQEKYGDYSNQSINGLILESMNAVGNCSDFLYGMSPVN